MRRKKVWTFKLKKRVIKRTILDRTWHRDRETMGQFLERLYPTKAIEEFIAKEKERKRLGIKDPFEFLKEKLKDVNMDDCIRVPWPWFKP